MGGGSWKDSDWHSYTSDPDKLRSRGKSVAYAASTSVHDIFDKRSLDDSLNPHGVKVRESCDSDDHPRSTALIVGLDVTGSMGSVVHAMAKNLNTLVTEVYDRKPISDPHIMCMGIGDADFDSAPLQATQFEADIRIAEQLEKLFIEGGGGGNSYESYALAWYFAARHTHIDCFEKRQQKGYLFTVGDEYPTPFLTNEHIKKVLGYTPQQKSFDADALLTEVSKKYEVFHVVVEQGSHASTHPDTHPQWVKLLGQHALRLPDHTKLVEVIVSAIQVLEGAAAKDVIKSWDGSTALAVGAAISGLSKKSDDASGLVSL